MPNLLEETLGCLARNGKSTSDVHWVESSSKEPVSFSWDEFASLASFEYDDGYGGNNIPLSLKIVGDDWWLERGEYDGSEWWEFKTLPIKPEYKQPRLSDIQED